MPINACHTPKVEPPSLLLLGHAEATNSVGLGVEQFGKKHLDMSATLVLTPIVELLEDGRCDHCCM